MSISAIKQSYIVKSVLLLSFLGIISLGLIGGCSDGGGGNDPQALTENDFAEDSSLRAELDEGVVVTFLESPGSEEENDTGTPGVDVIPVIYEETTEQTFCWEDDNAQAMHFMELRDLEGNLILTVDVNGDCVTQVIEAGEYVINIFHDESTGDTLPIFLIPNPEESEQARESDGIIGNFRLVASNILKRIEETVTRDARAQTVIQNTQTLFRTNSCVECNLDRARLRNATLIDVNLSGANLHLAQLGGANLSGANLSAANMSATLAREAVFIGADMRGAIMFLTFLIDADLSGVDLSGADLNQTILREADLSGAIMNQAIVRNAEFSSATWCDGCICAAESFGTCDGCAPVSICTGP